MIRFKENSKYGMKINIHTIPEVNKQLNIIHKKFKRKNFEKMMDENNFFTKDNYKKIQRWNNTLLKELPLQQL